MAFVTFGSYSGPSPEDPNAEFRKLFTVPANQQDGLSSILRYTQTKSGFTVGSTDTTLFHKILQDEFSDIVVVFPARHVSGETRLGVGELDEMIKNNSLPKEVLEFLPASKALQTKFLVGGGEQRWLTRSIIQFLNRMDARDLTLDVDEEHWIKTELVEIVKTQRLAYAVNRSRMAERADWLVNHLGLRDNLEDWCKRITSQGY